MFRSFIPVLSCALALAAVANGQEYQLKKGTRIPADRVKVTGETYTAVLTPPNGGAPETVTFTTKDIAQVTMPEGSEFTTARNLIAAGKGNEAVEAIKPALEKTKGLMSVPGSNWPEAMMIELDGYSVAGKSVDGVVDDATIRKLPSADADAVRNMVSIAAASKDAKQTTLDAMKSIANSSANSWITGRAWLQVGNIYANQGKPEEAVLAWLRVPVFSGAEKDLGLRGTIAAARGMQLINAPKDGIQLLDDYVSDYPLTSAAIKELIDVEKKKLTPKQKPSA